MKTRGDKSAAMPAAVKAAAKPKPAAKPKAAAKPAAKPKPGGKVTAMARAKALKLLWVASWSMDIKTRKLGDDDSYSQGVLNVNLGFWVIKKKTRNRQLRWSSPLSSPRRYEYHGAAAAAAMDWRATATSDGGDPLMQLKKEMALVSSIDIH